MKVLALKPVSRTRRLIVSLERCKRCPGESFVAFVVGGRRVLVCRSVRSELIIRSLVAASW
jgi:hypothetical protein